MSLRRTHPYQRPAQLRESVQSALLFLEVSRRVVYRDRNRWRTRMPLHGVSASFWCLPPAQLWELLEVANRNFRRLIRTHHPDRGGCGKQAAQLIAAWNMVKRKFARRGFELA